MKVLTESEKLDALIYSLQIIREEKLILLKDQFHITYESLKPINIIKSTLNEVATSPDIKNNIINNTIGLATGYISKKILFGGSHNPIKIIFGNLLQFAIGNVVSKHSESIKSTGENILNRLLKFKKDTSRDFQSNGKV